MTPRLCVHISTRRVQKKSQNKALGRSCGGLSPKIHAAWDALGHPIRFLLTGGKASDYSQALALLEGLKAKAILADKSYDADDVVAEIVKMKGEVVISSKSNRKEVRSFDKDLYKERNLIERLFNKLKNFRRVATRYDKTASAYLAFVMVAVICLWLK